MSEQQPGATGPEPGPGQSPQHVLFRSWPAVFPAAVCDAAVAEIGDRPMTEATIQTMDDQLVVAPETRQAANIFIQPGHWVASLITHFAHEANLLWNFELAGLGTLSLIRYEAGGHFNWHIDALAYDRVDYPDLGTGLERKLSVTVNLSDPDGYTGGELEFINGMGQLSAMPPIRAQGSVVVFPSTVGHRVTPVGSGVRYALVGWMVGPPLR